jgi:hypothetical protein
MAVIMDETGTIWRKFFASWPAGLNQAGVIVASNSEQVPFIGFLMAEHVLMLERPAPDTVGARKVVMPYSKIHAIKITDPVGNDVFEKAGFIESKSKQS